MSKEDKSLIPYQPKKELVKSTKNKFFEDLKNGLESYDDLQLTEAQADKVYKRLSMIKTGATALVPLICGGKAICPFRDRCVFVEVDQAPIGRPCAIEAGIHTEYMMRYMEEFNVDPNNYTEIGFVNELVEIDILQMRINMALARPENAELLVEQPGIATEMGVVMKKELSPLLEAKEKLANRKARIIKLMVGDRQEKYKKEAALKVREEKDASTKMSDLRRKIDALTSELNRTSDEEAEVILSPEDIIDADD